MINPFMNDDGSRMFGWSGTSQFETGRVVRFGRDTEFCHDYDGRGGLDVPLRSRQRELTVVVPIACMVKGSRRNGAIFVKNTRNSSSPDESKSGKYSSWEVSGGSSHAAGQPSPSITRRYWP